MFAFKERYPSRDIEFLAKTKGTERVIVPFYQPIVDQERMVIGFEVLARRWEADNNRYQSVDFPSLSDDESLNVDILMLRAILRDLPALAKRKTSMLSINLNPVHDSSIYQDLLLQALLQARRLDIEVWFEIVEYAPLQSKGVALIEVLRRNGAHIACDDFGSKECNFQRVMALPYEVIKLDRSLLLQATMCNYALRMLKGLVEYMQRFGIKVVCEGVESKTHIEIADHLGCFYQQGYAYSKPAPLSHWV